MPFSFSDPRTDALIRVLREHPDGATLIQIAARLTPLTPQRTLQRWLAKLVFVGLVARTGSTNQLRYFAGTGRGALPVKKRKPKAPRVAVSPPIAAPRPPEKPSRLPPQYRPLFDRLAPKIIRMGYTDDVAIDELCQGFVAEFRGAEVEAMNAFVAAAMDEFDGLDRDASLAKYKLSREDWDNWRRSWCKLRDLPPDKP